MQIELIVRTTGTFHHLPLTGEGDCFRDQLKIFHLANVTRRLS